MKTEISIIILFICSYASCQVEATTATENKNNNTILNISKLTDSKLSTKAINNGIELEIKKYKDSLNQEFNVEKLLLEIEYLKKVDASYKETILELKNEVEKDINKHENFIISRMNLYTFVFVSIIGLLAFIFNFFGKAAIKKRVEEIIQATAEIYAENKVNEVVENKISDEYIANIIESKGELGIVKLLADLDIKAKKVISSIKDKGEKIINSYSVSPQRSNNQKLDTTKNFEKRNDARKINRLIDELFDLTLKTKNPSIKVELFKGILNIDPNNIAALNNLGVAYNEQLNHLEAIKQFDKLIELNKDFSLAYANRADSYNLIGELDKSLLDANKAIELNPKLELAYAVKGNIQTKLKEFDKAEITLSKAIEINPISSVAYFNRGYFNDHTGKYQNSIADYLKAEELGYPNTANLYNNLAVSYRRIKQFNKALEYLEKAKESDGNWPNIYGTQALIYADMKDDKNFYKYLKIALDKGCPVWNYLSDTGFDNYRDSEKLKELIKSYKDSVDSNDK